MAAAEDWWRGALIYQIYPRSFQDSDGDGVGDLPGITARLDHVAALGCDAIWISPFFTSPMADFGYDVADYCDVDPLFGKLRDFDDLVDRAHALGLAVMIDLVLSHTSEQHPWFIESRSSRDNVRSDWYVWADPKPDGMPPNNWLSIFGGPAWEWDVRRRQYYLHNFLRSQPDLNYHCEAVQEAILDVARFWLRRGVDGFRLDTANYFFHDDQLRDNPPDPRRGSPDVPAANPYSWQQHLYDKTRDENLVFLRRFRAVLDEFGPIATIGEISDGERSLDTIAAYTSGRERLHMCYSFDFLGPELSKQHVEAIVRRFEAGAAEGWICWAFSNHDVDRHVSRWAHVHADPIGLARLTVALLTALRGAVCLYQGEEYGLGQAEVPLEAIQDPYGKAFWPAIKGRDGCRTPMVWEPEAPQGGFSTAARTWLPVEPAHLRRLAEIVASTDHQPTSDYRRFLALRHRYRALRDGSLSFLSAPGDILAFERRHGSERLLCLFNFARAAARWPLPADLRAREIEGAAIAASLEDGVVRLDGGGAIYLLIV